MIQMKNGDPLPSWISFEAGEQVFVITPTKHQAATYRDAIYTLTASASDASESAVAVFSIIVTGESYLQTAIKFLSIAFSTAGTIFGLWKKRVTIWNLCKKKQYARQDEEGVCGEHFTHKLAAFPAHEFGRLQVQYHNDRHQTKCLPHLELPLRQVKRVTLDDSWLKYDPDTQALSGTPTAAGVYTVSVHLESGKILERFKVHIIPGVQKSVEVFIDAIESQRAPPTLRSLSNILSPRDTESETTGSTMEGSGDDMSYIDVAPRLSIKNRQADASSPSIPRKVPALSRKEDASNVEASNQQLGWCLERKGK